jgi:hypothetical protein
MTTSNPGTIEVLTREDDNLSRGDRLEMITKAIPVDELRQQFKQFMSGLQTIIEEDAVNNGSFQLSEVEFSAEITGKGEFKLLGVGLGGEVSNAVKFILRRKTPEK